MKCAKYVQTDWHNVKYVNFIDTVTPIKPFKRKKIRVKLSYRTRPRKCEFECQCKCECKPKRKPILNEVVLSYVFKQQIYYIRYVNNMSLNWIPLSTSNGTGFVNANNSSQISSVIQTALVDMVATPNAPVVFLDYSKVSVGQGIKWPAKVFSPYVDSTAWPTFQLADNFTETKVPFYNLGFIVSKAPTICEPSWGGYYGAADGPLNEGIKKLRELGGDVTVSFGGAANVPLHVTAPDVNSLKEQYKRFVIAYGLTRIDFDLEGIWIDRAYEKNNINNSMALKTLQDELMTIGKTIDIWFTLPILPTGLTSDGLRIIQLALNAGVTIKGVNAMTMDYGDSAAPNPEGKMGQYGIQAITSLKNQLNTLYKGAKTEAELWAMIGTTPMIGKNDVVTEIFMQSDARQTLQFAQMNSIGMISMWSANRDNSAASGIMQAKNEFQQILNPYNSTSGDTKQEDEVLSDPQKKIQELKEENEILKKAMHFFAKERC